MKLSEKGKENLAGFGFAHNCDGAFSLLDDYEFEPDDFQGVVCLTVEEAKEMRHLMFGLEMEGVVPCDEFKDMRNNLKKRIEQAEGKR